MFILLRWLICSRSTGHKLWVIAFSKRTNGNCSRVIDPWDLWRESWRHYRSAVLQQCGFISRSLCSFNICKKFIRIRLTLKSLDNLSSIETMLARPNRIISWNAGRLKWRYRYAYVVAMIQVQVGPWLSIDESPMMPQQTAISHRWTVL